MISLRPATEADRAFLWGLHRAALRAAVEATWGWDEADQRRRFEASFDPARRQVVLLDGEPVGALGVEARPGAVRLDLVEVLPEHQGRGIGTAVVQRVVREAGGRPVELRVLRTNPRARVLYERLGFVETGATETHVEMRRASRP